MHIGVTITRFNAQRGHARIQARCTWGETVETSQTRVMVEIEMPLDDAMSARQVLSAACGEMIRALENSERQNRPRP